MEYIIQTNNLCKSYGQFDVLKSININVPQGAIYGLVGRNGAGKTTLIRILCGLHIESDGEFSLFGISNSSPEILTVRRKIGAVVETPAIYPEMTAKQNLMQQYKLLGMNPNNLMDVLKQVGLDSTGPKKAKDFSLGMRQRLGIAMAMVNDPELLILDEPINGLDPQGIVEIREMLIRLNKEKNTTIIISSHILDELSRLATHYGFMENGYLVKEMSAEELNNACRKSTRVTVSNTMILATVLKEMNLEYAILSESEADIYSTFSLNSLVSALTDKGCEMFSMNEHSESLENFFIKLVGGVRHE